MRAGRPLCGSAPSSRLSALSDGHKNARLDLCCGWNAPKALRSAQALRNVGAWAGRGGTGAVRSWRFAFDAWQVRLAAFAPRTLWRDGVRRFRRCAGLAPVQGRRSRTAVRRNGRRAMRPRRRWRSSARRRRSCRRRRSTRRRQRSRNIRISSPTAAGTRCRPAPNCESARRGEGGGGLARSGWSPRAISIRSRARGRCSIRSSKRRSSASRRATASAGPASSTRTPSPNSTCPPRRGCSSSRPTSSGCAPIPAISARAS